MKTKRNSGCALVVVMVVCIGLFFVCGGKRVSTSSVLVVKTNVTEMTQRAVQPLAVEASKTPRPTRVPAPTQEWRPLGGLVRSGLRVYFGANKAYAFTILGGDTDCERMPSGQGLYVEYQDGTREWKDWEAMTLSDYAFVRSNDPALESFTWVEFAGC